MVIDSSALIALFYRETDFEQIAEKMKNARVRFIAAPTFVEAFIVVIRRSGPQSADDLKTMLHALVIEVIDFTPDQADIAQDAFLRFGKGRHPARLNLGDCFAYALAKSFGQPLLFQGDDFSQTDIPAA